MKTKGLLFLIFTFCLFALGMLVTTIFNTTPSTIDTLVMFYVSLFFVLFGLIFLTIYLVVLIRTQITPGLTAIKQMIRVAAIIDVLAILLLVLQANNVLGWATGLILVLMAGVSAIFIKRRKAV